MRPKDMALKTVKNQDSNIRLKEAIIANTITMTVARAMNELKLLDKKIRKATQEGCFINFQIGKDGQPVLPGCDPTASFQKVQSLVRLRLAVPTLFIGENHDAKTKAKTTQTTR